MNYEKCHLNCPFNVNNRDFTKARCKEVNRFPLEVEDNGSNILLVFEAPGYYEWINSKPIYDSRVEGKLDSAGSRMAVAFETCNKNRNDYDIAEVVRCFPGRKSELKHTEIESAAGYCQKYLLEELRRKKYCRIICWGTISHTCIIDLIHSIQLEDPYYCPNVIYAKHPTNEENSQNNINHDVTLYL